MAPGASLGRTGRRVGYIDSAACRNSTRGAESNRLRVYLYTQGTPLEQLLSGVPGEERVVAWHRFQRSRTNHDMGLLRLMLGGPREGGGVHRGER